jgi:hypothetical protein
MVFSVTRFPTPPFYLIGRTGALGRAEFARFVEKKRSSMAAIGMSMMAAVLS